jgi:glutathione S-transferase
VPPFAPPILEHRRSSSEAEPLILSQLPNILLYLGPQTGLAPTDEAGRCKVNQVFLTLCDLQNEAVRLLSLLHAFRTTLLTTTA